MAARTKEKTSLSHSQGMDVSHGKRTTKPSIAESPEKERFTLGGEKPKPNYLKPTLSSRPDPCKHGKKQTYESQAPKRLVCKSSFEKPQSSTSQPQKIQGSSSFREKPLKTTSSVPKAATFLRSISEKVTTASKTISERATKAARSGKTQPSTKPKGIKRESSFSRKRENKSLSPVTSASRESSKTPSLIDEQEVKDMENVEVQDNKVDEEDQPQILHCQGKLSAESLDIEPETPENENVEALDSAIPTEEYEEDRKTEVEGIKENVADEENQERNVDQHETGEPHETTDQHEVVDQHETGEPHETTDQHEVVDQHEAVDLNETSDDQHETIDQDDTSDQQERLQTPNSKENGNVDVEQPEKSEDGDVESSEEKLENMGTKEEETLHGSEEGKEVTPMAEDEKEGIKQINTKEVGAAEKPEENSPVPGITSSRKNAAYNDVIEETASKLAEKRKNRVLALAGAFETVISLHESTVQVPKGRE